MTRVVAISSGLSDPSTTRLLADRITESITQQSGDVSVEVVSLRELAHDITDASLTGFASPRLQDVIDKVVAADGLVIVVPIFKASYPGLFKSFIDALETDVLIGKPVLLAASGGTARHSLAIDYALRPLMAYLQALVVPTGVFASAYDWGTDGSNALGARIDRAAGELVSLLKGAGTGRAKDDEFDLFSESFLKASNPNA
ncbi:MULTISPECIES: CE1759 family FMN reductase [Aeromicrobium]|uniref:NADPH-dependent FMN reductase n=1 Tax=Aeromicrobium yanjiei TaxID=2662028 RepID=A0A5Q2MGC6_9ACTN|nr:MULTISPECIES: CE1759 family FMN reductase [Aeromicrobium]MRK02490.1 NADPH-dependent FMN reductase [Aeromicrobium sp. S22]QGG40092.1 NADPH-dependent FMN reductase [Aeromicrobium yanjiei]